MKFINKETDAPKKATRTSPMDGSTLDYVIQHDGKLRTASTAKPKPRIDPKAATIDVNYFADGTFRWLTHGVKHPLCIEDLGCERAKTLWPNYVQYFDKGGTFRHGPAPFASHDEKNSYYYLFGFRPNERNELETTAFQDLKKRQKTNRPRLMNEIYKHMRLYGVTDRLNALNTIRRNSR